MEEVKITLNLAMEPLVKGNKLPSPCMFWEKQEQTTLHILHGKLASIQTFSIKSFVLQRKHIKITKRRCPYYNKLKHFVTPNLSMEQQQIIDKSDVDLCP